MLSLQRIFFGNLLACVLLVVLSTPTLLEAKNDDNKDRGRFYGLVEKMPPGFHGTWMVSGREITTNPRTEFDQREGPLRIGACVKVDIRSGNVHEIDSEPLSNCR